MRKLAMLLASAALTTGALAATAAPAGAKAASTGAARPAAVAQSKAAAAFPATYRIYNVRCYNDRITYSARQQENGLSGVTRFRQSAYEQEYYNYWYNITGTYTYYSSSFPNNYNSYYYILNWFFNHPYNGYSHRVYWQGWWLNRYGQTLYHASRYIYCY